MTQSQRIAVAAGLVVLLTTGAGLVYVAGRLQSAALPSAPATRRANSLGMVPEFALVERSGKRITRTDLAGKVWIAGFVFTRCSGPCPTLTAAMARLRSELPSEVQLVTITVDPDHDQPVVLAEYANRFRADPDSWWFLTGEREDVYRLVRDGFHLGVDENRDPKALPGERITHSTRLALVDRAGVTRGYFDGLDSAALAVLRRTVRDMLEESG